MLDLVHFWSFVLFAVYKEWYFRSNSKQDDNRHLLYRTRWFPAVIISLVLFGLAVTRERLTLDRGLQLITLCVVLLCTTDRYRLYSLAVVALISLGLEIVMHRKDHKLIALLHAPTMFMVHTYLTSLRMDLWWIGARPPSKVERLRAKRLFQSLYELRIGPLMTVIAVTQQILAFYAWYSGIVRSPLVLSFQFVLIVSYNVALVWNYLLCTDPNQLLLIPFVKNEFPEDNQVWPQFVTTLHSSLVISLLLTLFVL